MDKFHFLKLLKYYFSISQAKYEETSTPRLPSEGKSYIVFNKTWWCPPFFITLWCHQPVMASLGLRQSVVQLRALPNNKIWLLETSFFPKVNFDLAKLKVKVKYLANHGNHVPQALAYHCEYWGWSTKNCGQNQNCDYILCLQGGGGDLRVCIILYLLIINKAVYYYILYLELGKDYLAKVHTFKFAFNSIFLSIHELLLKTVRIGVSCWIFFSGFSVLLSLWYFDFSVLGYPLDWFCVHS